MHIRSTQYLLDNLEPVYSFPINIKPFPVNRLPSTGGKFRIAFVQGLRPIFIRGMTWPSVWIALTSETEGD